MKSKLLVAIVLSCALSLHASNGVFKNQRLMVVGVVIVILSAVGIGSTSLGIYAGCSQGTDGCHNLYWKIVPGFIVTASSGVLAIIGSMLRCCSGEEEVDYVPIN